MRVSKLRKTLADQCDGHSVYSDSTTKRLYFSASARNGWEPKNHESVVPLGLFLIVGCFIGGFYLIDYLSDDAYRTEFREGYVAYAQRIAPFIVADINSTRDIESTLEHWQSIVGEELYSLKIVALPEEHQQSGEEIIVAEISVTDFSDEIRLLIPADFSESNNDSG